MTQHIGLGSNSSQIAFIWKGVPSQSFWPILTLVLNSLIYKLYEKFQGLFVPVCKRIVTSVQYQYIYICYEAVAAFWVDDPGHPCLQGLYPGCPADSSDGPSRAVGNLRVFGRSVARQRFEGSQWAQDHCFLLVLQAVWPRAVFRRSVVSRLLHPSKLRPGFRIWRVEPALHSGGWLVFQGTSRCKCWCAPWVGRRAAFWFAKLDLDIGDGAALASCWSLKGASGTKPCFTARTCSFEHTLISRGYFVIKAIFFLQIP